MAHFLTMPEVWIGLGLLGALVYFLIERQRNKQQKARLARITRAPKKTVDDVQSSLRRKIPGAEGRLANYSIVSKLRDRLEIAGMAHITPQRILAIMAGLAVVTLLFVTVLLGKKLLIGILFAIVIGVGGPQFIIRRKTKKRRLAFLKLFPEAIELIVRGLRAGLPVAESFNTVSREIPPPLADVFITITQQIQLGMPMEVALTEAAKKLGITEFDFFVTTIILQRETGGNLGEILSNLADMLRQRQMMKLKISALSSEARASAIIVGALPFVVFALLSMMSPHYLEPFYSDHRGNIALMGALGIIGFGAIIMQRMTQLEI